MRDAIPDRLIRRPIVVALLVVAMLFGLTAVTTPQRAAGATTVRYDGDTLIRGVFFGLGPAAQQYPKLVLGAIAEPGRNAAIIPRLFTAAEQTAPGFRERFASAMYSRDRVRIQRTVLDTGDILFAALLALYPDLEDDLTAAGGTQGTATLLWILNVIAVAAQAAAAAQAVVVVEFVAFWFKDPSAPKDNQLRLERWTDLVATTLPGT